VSAQADPGRVLGRGIAFPPRVGGDGRVAWSEGEQNVREGIRVVLATEQRERLRLADFGAGLGRALFEPNTVATRRDIQARIVKALERWEPRIAVESVAVDEIAGDPEVALATITYKLVATGARESVAASVVLGG
jgi:phage baseplate assembly protein W